MTLVRYGIPAALLIVGVALLLLNPEDNGFEGWALLTGVGLSVLLLNTLHRIGVSGDVARDREEEAREHFDRHGRWPDEEKPAAPREWSLPENVATPESEAAAAWRAQEPDPPPR